VLFKQSLPPPSSLQFLLYANGRRLTAIRHTTRIADRSSPGSDYKFELSNGPADAHVLRSGSLAEHSRWLSAARSAAGECTVAVAVSAVPLSLFGLSSALAKAAALLPDKSPLLAKASMFCGYLEEVKEMHAFVASKDPGFHSGLLRDSPELAALVAKVGRIPKIGNFEEFEALRDYKEGRDFGSRARASDLVRGSMELKKQLEVLSRSMSMQEESSSEEEEEEEAVLVEEEEEEEEEGGREGGGRRRRRKARAWTTSGSSWRTTRRPCQHRRSPRPPPARARATAASRSFSSPPSSQLPSSWPGARTARSSSAGRARSGRGIIM
jgi:hypothetical protein